MPNFGSSGIDFTNHRLNGAATFFNEPDPALLPFGHFEIVNTGGDGGQTAYRFVPNADSGLTEQGYVRGPNGENLSQLQPEGNYNLADPSATTNDPRYGRLTDRNNIRLPHDMWDNWLPVLVGAGLLGPVAFSAMGAEGGAGLLGGEAAGDGLNIGLLENLTEPTMQSLNLSGLEGAMNGLGLTAGEGGFTLPEMMQNFETPPINEMNTGGLDSVMQGLNGAPVTDLSTQAGMGDQLRNLVPGGLLSNASSLMRLAGLGLSLSGLGGGGNRNSNTNNNNSNNNNGGGKGGNGQGLNITRGEYQRNPITQRQLEQFRYARPQGLLGGY